jgi:hypothetical protein
MTARRRAILIILLGLLLLGIIVAAVIYLLRSRTPVAKAPAAAPTTSVTAPVVAPAPSVADPLNPPVVAVVVGRTAAAQMAELFAERYGSYSNQGDFQNLTDLLPVMTDGYRAKTEAYLASATSSDLANYQGVTSLKISTKVLAYDESAGTAIISVNLQQQKSGGAPASAGISYRSLRMSLLKVGDSWKVDSAAWEN